MRKILNLMRFTFSQTAPKMNNLRLCLNQTRIQRLLQAKQSASFICEVKAQIKEIQSQASFNQLFLIAYIYELKIFVLTNAQKIKKMNQFYAQINSLKINVSEEAINFQRKIDIKKYLGIFHILSQQKKYEVLSKLVEFGKIRHSECLLIMKQCLNSTIDIPYDFAEELYTSLLQQSFYYQHEEIKIKFITKYEQQFCPSQTRFIKLFQTKQLLKPNLRNITFKELIILIDTFILLQRFIQTHFSIKYYRRNLSLINDVARMLTLQISLEQCFQLYMVLQTNNIIGQNTRKSLIQRFLSIQKVNQNNYEPLKLIFLLINKKIQPLVTFDLQINNKTKIVLQYQQFIIIFFNKLIDFWPEIILETNSILFLQINNNQKIKSAYKKILQKKFIDFSDIDYTRKLLKFMEIYYNQLPSIKSSIQFFFQSYQLDQKINPYFYFEIFFRLFQLYANNGIHQHSYSFQPLSRIRINQQLLNQIIIIRNEALSLFVKNTTNFNTTDQGISFLILFCLRYNEIIEEKDQTFFYNILKSKIKYIIPVCKEQDLLKLMNIISQQYFSKQEWFEIVEKMVENLYYFITYCKMTNKFYANQKYDQYLFIFFKIILNLDLNVKIISEEASLLIQILSIRFIDKLAKTDLNFIYNLVKNSVTFYPSFKKIILQKINETDNFKKRNFQKNNISTKQSFFNSRQYFIQKLSYYQELTEEKQQTQKWLNLIQQKNFTKTKIQKMFENQFVYLDLLICKEVNINFPIPQPKNLDKNIQIAYICLRIYQKIVAQLDFSLNHFFDSSFKEIDLSQEIQLIKDNNIITFSLVNDYRIEERKLPILTKYECWSENILLKKQNQLYNLNGEIYSDNILINLLKGIVGEHEHIQKVCQQLVPHSRFQFMLEHFDVKYKKIKGAITKIDSAVVLNSIEKFHKILIISAYFLSKRKQTSYFVETNPQPWEIKELAERLREKDNSNKEEDEG